MKKSYKKILTTFISVAFVSFFATGCFDPAFYEINQDVPSKDATLSGNIVSIARYTVGETEYLVSYAGETEVGNINTARGVVYKPADNAQYGEWKNLDGLPFELSHYDYYGKQDHLGQQIIKVLADSENIYVVSVEWMNNIGEGTNCPKWVHLWTVKPTDTDNDGTWDSLSVSNWKDLNPIPLDVTDSISGYKEANYEKSKLPVYEGSDDYYYSAFNVFSTNSPKKANRKVFLRRGFADGNAELKYPAVSYFEVSPTGFTDYTVQSIIVGNENKTTVYEKNSDGYYYNANAVAIVKEVGTIFFGTTTSNNAIAVTTNETYSTDASKFYYSSGEKLYYGSSTTDLNDSKLSAGSWITSLAYCKDAILIGRGGTSAYNSTSSTSSGGIEKVQLTTDDIPAKKLGTFTTNAQSQLLTSYIVQMLFNATPDKDELDSILYASLTFTGTGSSTTASYSNIGMWAYYPERGNWNRE